MRKARRAVCFLLRMGFPWVGRRNDPWACAARRAVLRRWPVGLRPLIWGLSAVIWPVSSLWLSARAARRARNGPRGLWLACWQATLSRNIPPREFVLYQLHRPGALRSGWRFETETATWLGQNTNPETVRLVSDKRTFQEWLARRGVPAVLTLPHLSGADQLVTKPRSGGRGHGMCVWIRQDDMLWRPAAGFGGKTGEAVGEEALLAKIAEQDLLLQPFVRPDPGLGVALVARIVTSNTDDGAALVDAVAQVPAEGDLASHRGPFRRIRGKTGEIRGPGPGQRSRLSGGIAPRFPLEGHILPGWEAILTHVIEAHAALPAPAPLIGWDVIWGAGGPLVLEANIGIGLTLFQLDTLEPAGVPEIAS
ncbi:MAG: hypothetical protein AAGE80_16500 [Pseudomonadota bacterium]